MKKVQVLNHAAFVKEGALISVGPGRVVLAWGPFHAAGQRESGKLAFYCPDFLLEEKAPWQHPSGWIEVDLAHLNCFVGEDRQPVVEWVLPQPAAFRLLYDDVMNQIEKGDMVKAVPIIFEDGRLAPNVGFIQWLVGRCASINPHLHGYGIWNERGGMFGATPEHLFSRTNEQDIQTMAVAGTAPCGTDAAGLLDDHKLRHEHQIVIDDISGRLGALGDISVETTHVVSFGVVDHLVTNISVLCRRSVTFEALVHQLHPTAALGVAPRNQTTWAWLRAHSQAIKRRRFGAPFGIEWSDGRAVCLVAIRNVEWNVGTLRVGSGCGVVAGSTFDGEWDELKLKRESVKRMLGLL